jgi:hypothetical protein
MRKKKQDSRVSKVFGLITLADAHVKRAGAKGVSSKNSKSDPDLAVAKALAAEAQKLIIEMLGDITQHISQGHDFGEDSHCKKCGCYGPTE